ncbi:MAG TPA: class I SAM-dependent methyltransferase [Tepidisphaeraceae bacterium]|nr:class I SAM-dependent methyltransferase [Tepidisphaeraceae bacterium]
MAANEARLHEFMGKAVSDLGAAMSVPLFIIGERLGLYKAMAGAGAMTAAQLAKKAKTDERCTREWLMNQAAGGYVNYDAKTESFTLPDEQALAMADENSPVFMHGAYDVIQSLFRDLSKFETMFRSGKGLGWGEHDGCLFTGTARFFKPNYVGNIVTNWIPALDGMKDRLLKGASVVDVGCGYGYSTMLMAEAFPKSEFVGFDTHEPSIEKARKLTREAGIMNCRFEVGSALDFPGDGFDMVACFDCLHDMADPVGASKRIKQALKKDGAWMIVEPFANDKPEENFNPIGRVFYGASTLICVPASQSGNGPALGAQAGEKKLGEVVKQGGFTKFRRATQTPFNLVLEARP